ncbi:MAG: hypothetical protein ACI8WB_004148 [Phenylobacterium sp.]|jgi:hypothetical protein
MLKSQTLQLNQQLLIHENCQWFQQKGHCDQRLKWTFKIFHQDPEALKNLCGDLFNNGFMLNSVRWNKDPDYQVEGWVASVYVVEQFSCDALYDFRFKLEIWLYEKTPCRFIDYHPTIIYPGKTQKHQSVHMKQSDPDYKLVNQVFHARAAEVIDWNNSRAPKNSSNSNKADWETKWQNGLTKEHNKRKTQALGIATSVLDKAYAQACVQANEPSAIFADQWVPFCDFCLKGRSVFLTAMCPGPMNDGVKIKLNSGDYELNIKLGIREDIATLLAVNFIQSKRTYDTSTLLERISIDGATLGIYDYERLRACLGYDLDTLYSWGESKRANLEDEQSYGALYGVLVYDLKRGYLLPYLQTGDGDGVYPVNQLFDNGELVGVEVCFIASNYGDCLTLKCH